jgi:hypothetical protein
MGMFALRVQEPGAAEAELRWWPRQQARIAPNQIVGRLRRVVPMCFLTVIAFIGLFQMRSFHSGTEANVGKGDTPRA